MKLPTSLQSIASLPPIVSLRPNVSLPPIVPFSLIASVAVLASLALNCPLPVSAKGFPKPVVPDEVLFTISGRVVKDGKPVKNCSVSLFEPDGQIAHAVKTPADGEFSIRHKEATRLTLEVTPPEKLECAQSIVENLPGSADRKLIIELHKGYLVSGRVLFRQPGRKDVGLKGFVVKVEPLDKGVDGRAQVHGAGYCLTEKDGVFSLRLTEGKKRITFVNNKFSDLPGSLSRDVNVSSDQHLGAIVFHSGVE